MGNHMKVGMQMNGMYDRIYIARSTEAEMLSDKRIQGMMVRIEEGYYENGVNLHSQQKCI